MQRTFLFFLSVFYSACNLRICIDCNRVVLRSYRFYFNEYNINAVSRVSDWPSKARENTVLFSQFGSKIFSPQHPGVKLDCHRDSSQCHVCCRAENKIEKFVSRTSQSRILEEDHASQNSPWFFFAFFFFLLCSNLGFFLDIIKNQYIHNSFLRLVICKTIDKDMCKGHTAKVLLSLHVINA